MVDAGAMRATVEALMTELARGEHELEELVHPDFVNNEAAPGRSVTLLCDTQETGAVAIGATVPTFGQAHLAPIAARNESRSKVSATTT